MSLPPTPRERVLRAATRSFLAHGYGSSVDYIAKRAGVAKQTVYHHFPSKAELFEQVFEVNVNGTTESWTYPGTGV